MEYATGLDIGNRKRRHGGINEDSVAVNLLEDCHLDADRDAGVFVLADGAGGEAAGEVASYVATVEVTRRLTQALWDARSLDSLVEASPSVRPARRLEATAGSDPAAEDGPERLLDRIETAIESTHTRILQTVEELGLESAYTTIVAGIKTGDHLYYGWVGDSRAYVVNEHPDRMAGERISRLTRDHSVVERLLQRGEIDAIEAHVHRKGNRITRALGGTAGDDPVANTVEVETNYVRLFSDDTVLFTSDGLIDAYVDAPTLHERYLEAESTATIEETILEKSVTDDELRDVILEADSLDGAADRFVSLANQRGGKDNISVALFRDRTLDRSPADGLPIRSPDRTSPSVGDRETVIRDPDP